MAVCLGAVRAVGGHFVSGPCSTTNPKIGSFSHMSFYFGLSAMLKKQSRGLQLNVKMVITSWIGPRTKLNQILHGQVTRFRVINVTDGDWGLRQG